MAIFICGAQLRIQRAYPAMARIRLGNRVCPPWSKKIIIVKEYMGVKGVKIIIMNKIACKQRNNFCLYKGEFGVTIFVCIKESLAAPSCAEEGKS